MNQKLKNRTIYIRCDGSPSIGAGHVMRMMALAQQLKQCGHSPVFLMRALSDNLSALVREKGFFVDYLPGIEDTFEINETEERHSIQNLLRSEDDMIIVDHYGYQTSMLEKISALCKNIVLIDDFQPERNCGEVRVIVNQHFSAKVLDYPYYDHQLRLLGPQYALLREEFSDKTYHVKPQCENVLISFGAADTANMTLPILNLINDIDGSLHITVIAGSENQKFEQLNEAAKQSRHHVILKKKSNNMAQEMLQQDLLILSASTLVLEASALGIPCCVMSCVDNQLAVGVAVKAIQPACYLGDYLNTDWSEISRKISALIQNVSLRSNISSQLKSTVDSHGSKNVAENIVRRFL